MRAIWQRFIYIERYLRIVLFSLMSFIAVIFFIRFFVVSPARVDGPSMEPTLYDENLFFVNRLIYLLRTPERYDIVQIAEPLTDKLMVKRIIGLPGEIITVKQGKVFVRHTSGVLEYELDESTYLGSSVYTKLHAQQRPYRYAVGPDEYFVMGDNRPSSVDSRIWGAIDRTKIVGRVTRFSK